MTPGCMHRMPLIWWWWCPAQHSRGPPPQRTGPQWPRWLATAHKRRCRLAHPWGRRRCQSRSYFLRSGWLRWAARSLSSAACSPWAAPLAGKSGRHCRSSSWSLHGRPWCYSLRAEPAGSEDQLWTLQALLPFWQPLTQPVQHVREKQVSAGESELEQGY